MDTAGSPNEEAMRSADVPLALAPATAHEEAATLARLFWDRIALTPDREAQLVKRHGAWVRSTWAEVGVVVREIALGLLALGRRPGEAVAILSRTRAEWVEADFAIFSIGGVTVPIYTTSTVEEIAYTLSDADVRTLIVEGDTTRARDTRRRAPGVEQMIIIGDGAVGDTADATIGWDELRRLGREARDAGELAQRVAAVQPDDVASIVYTSGTTGTPKGVVQSHRNLVAMLHAIAQLPGVEAGDRHLLFLPLAHAFARIEALMAVHRGLVTAFAQSAERLASDLREVQPDFLFAVPRLFGKAHGRMMREGETGASFRRGIFRWAIGTARSVTRLREAGAPVPLRLRLAHAVAQRTVLQRLRAVFGGRLRFAVSGGAPLGRDLAEFFLAIGIPVLEGYGLTEACPVLTWNRLDSLRLGSVGRALPGVEIRLADDGEVLARGPNIARGYLNNPEETAAVFGADGWLHTGDIGRIDAAGFLYITDRKKDLIVTSAGLHIAPQAIEAALRCAPLIADAMVYGDRRPFLTALLTLDREEVERLAAARGVPVGEWAALVRDPAVLDHVKILVDATNEALPPHARVRRFFVVPASFSELGGELTPTQKIKRRVVAERYRETLDALYR